MTETTQKLIEMARAAMRDERLFDGALYGKLADEIERLNEALALNLVGGKAASGFMFGGHTWVGGHERERCARACERVAADRPAFRIAALECSKVVRSLGDADG